MRASIVSVGDEILEGEIANTNGAWLAKQLSERGVSMVMMIVVGDDLEEIKKALKMCDSDWIFVTGGLGPTHDDVTREGVAAALGKELKRNKEAEKMLIEKFNIHGELLHLADLPEGSEVIENPVGVAPGFIVENIVVLPGAPEEMREMFLLISHRFRGKIPKIEWIITRRAEHTMIHIIKEFLERFPDVKIGSYPVHEIRNGKRMYEVKIRLSSTNYDMLREAKNWLEENLWK
ncbi:MAG: competence/damage-inducible protein A [Candidatus Syntropharchaeia archaeon]